MKGVGGRLGAPEETTVRGIRRSSVGTHVHQSAETKTNVGPFATSASKLSCVSSTTLSVRGAAAREGAATHTRSASARTSRRRMTSAARTVISVPSKSSPSCRDRRFADFARGPAPGRFHFLPDSSAETFSSFRWVTRKQCIRLDAARPCGRARPRARARPKRQQPRTLRKPPEKVATRFCVSDEAALCRS